MGFMKSLHTSCRRKRFNAACCFPLLPTQRRSGRGAEALTVLSTRTSVSRLSETVAPLALRRPRILPHPPPAPSSEIHSAWPDPPGTSESSRPLQETLRPPSLGVHPA